MRGKKLSPLPRNNILKYIRACHMRGFRGSSCILFACIVNIYFFTLESAAVFLDASRDVGWFKNGINYDLAGEFLRTRWVHTRRWPRCNTGAATWRLTELPSTNKKIRKRKYIYLILNTKKRSSKRLTHACSLMKLARAQRLESLTSNSRDIAFVGATSSSNVPVIGRPLTRPRQKTL